MWKILVGFIIFAAIALTVVFQMGDKASMQGESGGHESSAPEKKADAPAAAPAAADAEKK
jgi:hypothetical protein